jgi:hypothetical protein
MRAFPIAALALTQTGCIVVGYRTGAGWSVWPGGFFLLIMVVLVLFFFLRRV